MLLSPITVWFLHNSIQINLLLLYYTQFLLPIFLHLIEEKIYNKIIEKKETQNGQTINPRFRDSIS